ncbi:hypothetical protein [Brucella sp.]|uniref:hypothetical protein n=1 Tax=Brucella sp. TaxID=52132 RepID=UPI0028A60DEA|nr:hypothetical protein [Brucella sp.]
MANELKPWKYDIQYGPEGEANYAWVYDDHGVMVATMKTHKAKEIVDRMNTRPAAPVEGLKTTLYQVFLNGCWIDCPKPAYEAYLKDNEHVRRLCLQLQAEAIIAAERADTRIWMEKAAIEAERVSKLETDNAALTARVKGLEEDRDSWRRVSERLERDSSRQSAEKETLETKLAAAEEREKKAFKAGYVLACCNVVHQHDEPTIAHDALGEIGVTKAEIKAMKLSEFDMKALRLIERDRASSPYAKAKP